MSLDPAFENKLDSYVNDHRDRLVDIIRDLVRIPSENTPPDGCEETCQEYVAEFLREQGLHPTLYQLGDVPGLKAHPLYGEGRNYQRRPNVGARKKGSGGGRSLVLSGHIDTVPRGSQPGLAILLAGRWMATAFTGAAQMT